MTGSFGDNGLTMVETQPWLTMVIYMIHHYLTLIYSFNENGSTWP